jgi:hypothetical protein
LLSFLCSFLNNLIFDLNRLKGGVCVLIVAFTVAIIRLYNQPQPPPPELPLLLLPAVGFRIDRFGSKDNFIRWWR